MECTVCKRWPAALPQVVTELGSEHVQKNQGFGGEGSRRRAEEDKVLVTIRELRVSQTTATGPMTGPWKALVSVGGACTS